MKRKDCFCQVAVLRTMLFQCVALFLIICMHMRWYAYMHAPACVHRRYRNRERGAGGAGRLLAGTRLVRLPATMRPRTAMFSVGTLSAMVMKRCRLSGLASIVPSLNTSSVREDAATACSGVHPAAATPGMSAMASGTRTLLTVPEASMSYGHGHTVWPCQVPLTRGDPAVDAACDSRSCHVAAIFNMEL